jgi:hypothetical protein
MHAVVVSVTIHDGEEATKYLRGEIVPRVKQAPGFVAGYWVRVENGDQGRGTIVFESEDAARAAAEQIQQNPGSAVTLDNVGVGEAVESAWGLRRGGALPSASSPSKPAQRNGRRRSRLRA